MELRRHVNFKNIFIVVYVLAFVLYIIIGLQPAKAHNYDVSGQLYIPKIDLVSDVTTLELNNKKLDTPDTIVGSYSRNDNKTLLIGHSTTVFQNLDQVQIDDMIRLDNQIYYVDDIVVQAKDDISMMNLLKKEDKDTLVIMTCAGELLSGGDATHRLIITASIR